MPLISKAESDQIGLHKKKMEDQIGKIWSSIEKTKAHCKSLYATPAIHENDVTHRLC